MDSVQAMASKRGATTPPIRGLVRKLTAGAALAGLALMASAYEQPGDGVYRTKDERWVAAAPLESQFWSRFCTLVGIAETADSATVASAISQRTAAQWKRTFEGEDVCCTFVASVEEALHDPQFVARNVFARTVESEGKRMPALPLPLVPAFRDPVACRPVPNLPAKASATDRSPQTVK